MRIGHASIGENNKVTNGKAGDQTGKEVCIRSYYDKNWNFVLRPRNPDIAEKTAKACESMCNNEHIGYDQNGRNTLLVLLESLKWNYMEIKQDVECDCSSFMTACAICGGAKIKYKNNAPTTRTMVAKFKESGYYEAIRFVNPKYTNLKRGDILVREGSHTAMVLDDYAPTTEKKSIEEIAAEVIAGKWGSGNDRRQRLSNAGYDYKQIQDLVNKILKG